MYGRGNALLRLHYVWTGKCPCCTSNMYGRGNAHATPALCMDGETPMLHRWCHYEWETPCRGGTMNGKHPVAVPLCMDREMPMPCRHYVWTGKCPCRAGTMYGRGSAHAVPALCMDGEMRCHGGSMYGRGNAHAAPALCMNGETPMPHRHYVWTGKRPCCAAGTTMNGKCPVAVAL